MRRTVAVLCTIHVLAAGAQQFKLWRHFDSSNGMPQNSVLHMAKDAAGFVWITTEGGLARFGGASFKTFDLAAGKGPRALRMRQIVPMWSGDMVLDDAFGNLYRTHAFQSARPVPSGRSQLILQGMLPNVNVCQWMVGNTGTAPNPPWQDASTVFRATSTHDWQLANSRGLYSYRDSTLLDTVRWEQPVVSTWWVEDQWFGVDAKGDHVRLDPSTGGVLPVIWEEGSVTPGSIMNRWKRLFWRGGEAHLLVFDPDGLKLLTPGTVKGSLRCSRLDAELPPFNTVHELLYDPERDLLFVGTASDGLSMYRPQRVVTSSCAEMIEMGGSLYAQAAMADGSVLVAGQDYKLYRTLPGSCMEIPFKYGVYKHSLLQHSGGGIWMKVGPELVAWSPATEERRVMMTGLVGGIAMLEVKDTVFVADLQRLYAVLRNGRIDTLAFFPEHGEKDRPVILRKDLTGRLIYGSSKGLHVQDGAEYAHFLSHPAFEDQEVRSIAAIEGCLFVGTYGSGGKIIRNDTVFTLPMDRWGSLQYIHAFVTGAGGSLWMSTNQGLIRTTLADVFTAIDHPEERPYYAQYGELDGMSSMEMNGGCDPAFVRLPDGRFSFPSIQGLVQFHPDALGDPFPADAVIPGRVTVDGELHPLFTAVELPHDVQDLSFEFSLPYWGNPINAQLEYRIEGITDSWTLLPPTARRIDVVRPPPGQYWIELRKVGSTARGIAHEPMLWFTVDEPFYRTWWARAAYVLATILLIVTGIKLNSVRLRNRNRWLEENVAQQTENLLRTNEELKSAVAQQEKLIAIIAHDVVPPLRFISRVARSAEELDRSGHDPQTLRETLGDLRTSSKKLYDNAAGLLAWIRARSRSHGPVMRPVAMHAAVGSALDRVREMAESQGVLLHNAVDPEDIVVSDEDLLAIVLNNVLVNALNHASAQAIIVQANRGPAHYSVEIHDDGKGIRTDVLDRIQDEIDGRSARSGISAGPAAGLGYVIVAECMRTLGGSVRVENRPQGTRVTLELRGTSG